MENLLYFQCLAYSSRGDCKTISKVHVVNHNNFHGAKYICFKRKMLKNVRWLQLFIQTFFLTSLFRFKNI